MTQVEVCNLALGWVGSELISSVNDATTPARLVKAAWAPTRDVVLAEAEWAFATRRYTLAADTVAPAFGWTKRFPIPSNVLLVRRCIIPDWDESVEWEREGQFILSDEATIYAVCTVKVETTADLPEYFGRTLAALMASDLSIPIAQSSQMQGAWYQVYLRELRSAKSLDGVQGRSRMIRGPGLARVR